MPKLKVAIIGCGRMGRERARCVKASDAVVSAVFDVDRKLAAMLAKDFDAEVSPSGEGCLDQSPDAVFICIAPGYRGALEMLCARRAIPLMVEKPIGISAHDQMPLLTQLRERPVINAVGYMNRYRRSVNVARKSLRNASILGMSMHWVCKPYGVSWWADSSLSGGPHNEQATHIFDLCRFLLGEIVEVSSLAERSSAVSCLFRFSRGPTGTSFYSCDAQNKDIGIRIFAKEGSLSLSGWNFQLTQNTIDGTLCDTEEEIFQIETAAFLSAVQSRKQDLVMSDFFDAYKTQLVMDAIGESQLNRTLVSVPFLPIGVKA